MLSLTTFLEEINIPPRSPPRPTPPFAALQMDFIDLPPAWGESYNLVVVCMFSGWMECDPTRCADAHKGGEEIST